LTIKNKTITTQYIIFSISQVYAQIHDNGLGGFGYVQYDIMHNSKFQENWMTGGG
jgi:hypothetical protein